jgi:hypothetical protein
MGLGNGASRGRLGACLAIAAATLTLSLFAPKASAEISFCPPGQEAGQCDEPRGIAVDRNMDRIYVTDRRNNRVNVFDSGGSFKFAFGWGVATGSLAPERCGPAISPPTVSCLKGLAGSGPGQFDSPVSIAVDNDPLSGSHHRVYVGTDNFRIQKFDAEGNYLLGFGSQGKGECEISEEDDSIAVGPGGTVYVADPARIGAEVFASRIQKFTPAGICFKEIKLFEGSIERIKSLAVDSQENTYVTVSAAAGIIRKYSPTGTLLYALDTAPLPYGSDGLSVDAADNLFAAQREVKGREVGTYNVITAYDSSGNHLSRFGYGRLQARPPTLAAHHTFGGDVFAVDEGKVKYLALPSSGPIIPPGSIEVTAIGNSKATVGVEVNPEGKATDLRFDYVDQEGFEGAGFSGPTTRSVGPVAVDTGASEEFRVQAVDAVIGCSNATKALIAEGKCLNPETTYHFRVVATNADNPGGSGEATAVGPPFTTNDPLEIEATFAAEVGTDSAGLNAKVNPLGIPTTGFFEYVDDASYQQSGFAEAVEIPAVAKGETEIDFGSGEVGIVRGVTLYPLEAGTTYHYRLLATDPLIEGALISDEHTFTTFEPSLPEFCPGNSAFRTGSSILLPDCRVYELVSPLDKANGDIKVLGETLTGLPAVLEQSSVSGEKLAYGSYRAFGGAESAPVTSQYIATRGEGGWSSHAISPPRTTPIIAPLGTFDTEFKLFSPDLCESWLRTFTDPPLATGAVEGYSTLYRRRDEGCGGESYEALSTVEPPNVDGHDFEIELQGVSMDGSHAIFRAGDALTAAASAKQKQLYAVAGGAMRFLCVLPGGTPSKVPCTAGTTTNSTEQRSRRSSVHNAISADGSRVFWTDADGPGKIYLRQNVFGPGGECSGAGSPCSIAVSKDAEALSKTTSSLYLGAADDGSKAIFSSNEDLYEFEVATKVTRLIAKGVAGLVGLSEDASRIYLVSSKVLGAGAVNGEPNLYLYEAGAGGSFTFIATLAAADLLGAASFEPARHTTRVSADGSHAVFMSAAALTDYDNADAVSGAADAEVYLYDAVANGGAGSLVCVSCNPSGARPVGAEVGGLWTAAKIPPWENMLYASRVLSGAGTRLYFESVDALTPRDTNDRQDVYQWEQSGTGGCDGGDATFVSSSGGCVDLISSGQSIRSAGFVESSPSGDDVFFTTLASLLPFDYGLVDIYDARVGGGLPASEAAPVECEGEACRHPAAPPQDTTPSSLAYEGPGNLVKASRKPRCPKGKVRRKGRCVKTRHDKPRRGKHRDTSRAKGPK